MPLAFRKWLPFERTIPFRPDGGPIQDPNPPVGQLAGPMNAAIIRACVDYALANWSMADPNHCREQCYVSAMDFMTVLGNEHVPCELVSGVVMRGSVILNGHFATSVVMDDGTHMVIDWTYRQFIPSSEWPRIMPLDEWRTEFIDIEEATDARPNNAEIEEITHSLPSMPRIKTPMTRDEALQVALLDSARRAERALQDIFDNPASRKFLAADQGETLVGARRELHILRGQIAVDNGG